MLNTIDYSKSQKKMLSGMPKLTTEERAFNYQLAREIIDRNRDLGKGELNKNNIKKALN